MSIPTESVILDRSAFQTYKQLRKIATQYNVEKELEVPQIVIVGETSVGKSMLVQNFLQFPCSFSTSNVGTRCPISYRLVHNAKLEPGDLKVVKPNGVRAETLGDYLKNLMERIQEEYRSDGGFRLKCEEIEIESNAYTDFEIVDVPGLVGGDANEQIRCAVETIVEFYVRDPRFSIVLLKEAMQVRQNSHGARRIEELCTSAKGIKSQLPPRMDYRNHMITIQTKFDVFMQQNTDGTQANQSIAIQIEDFDTCYFVNMIFNGFSMNDETFETNVQYIRDLPEVEKNAVDRWVEDINRKANTSAKNYEKFNLDYRSLIGIKVVRQEIQKLWLKSFISALPKLRNIVSQQLDIAKNKYDDFFEQSRLSNPVSIKKKYLEYVGVFRSTLCQYIAYKSEIDSYFPKDECGLTYEQVVNGFLTGWKRRHPQAVQWRAYLPPIELCSRGGDRFAEILNMKYVGAKHFDRLYHVFSLMVLTYQTRKPDPEWIETTQSLLYGGLTDYPNAEKAAREITRTLIREIFLKGICWLTQIATYLLDMFKADVTKYLLCTAEKYPYLKGHIKFLALVDLDYHKTVRELIQNAIRMTRDARDIRSNYAHYDVTARMATMLYSIPRHISHKVLSGSRSGTKSHNHNAEDVGVHHAIPTVQSDLLKLIFGSESFLTNIRDPLTGSHFNDTQKSIEELYAATRMLLVQDIRASFNSSVVMKMQKFDVLKSSSIYNSLLLRISRMTSSQIHKMTNSNISEIRVMMQKYATKIDDLIDAIAHIDLLIRAMKREDATQEENSDSFTKKLKKERETREKQRLTKENYDSAVTISNDADYKSEIIDQEDHDDEVEKELLAFDDNVSSNQYLLNLYREHDEKDLKDGLLDGESLDQDSLNPSAQYHLHIRHNEYGYEDPSIDSTSQRPNLSQTNGHSTLQKHYPSNLLLTHQVVAEPNGYRTSGTARRSSVHRSIVDGDEEDSADESMPDWYSGKLLL